MTQNQIRKHEGAINFLSRLLLANIAGIYLLAAAIGGYMIEWLARDEFAWSEFGIVPAIAVALFVVMSLSAVFLYRKINRHIDRIGETPCSKTST